MFLTSMSTLFVEPVVKQMDLTRMQRIHYAFWSTHESIAGLRCVRQKYAQRTRGKGTEIGGAECFCG